MNLRMPSLALACGLVLGACSNPTADKPKATVDSPSTQTAPSTQVASGPVRTFTFDGSGSKVEFVGSKLSGSHSGGFNAFTGRVELGSAGLASAQLQVEIDMTSTHSDHPKLTGHLKSPDFFDVEQFPTATFVSRQVAGADAGAFTVTGDLTLHGVTKTISFPATASVDGNTLTTNAEFAIDRQQFDITYPGRPDDLIRDDVLIKLMINATASGA
ncbi:MAG: YceI family protein [Acidobacteriota bacterium]